jgi:hypothetical protein
MNVLDADFIQLERAGLLVGRASVKLNGYDWPPPERILTAPGEAWVRVSYSSLDDEAGAHPNLARGALYIPESEMPEAAVAGGALPEGTRITDQEKP